MPFDFTCETCGKTFTRDSRKGPRNACRFCGVACSIAPRKGIPGPGGSVLVPLTRGKFAVIDVEDADLVLAYNWSAKFVEGKWYARRNLPRDQRPGTILMHRFILGTPPRMLTDHVDGDGLNNRRGNLRIATPAQNNANQRLHRTNTSGYKGVVWSKELGRWHVRVGAGGRRVHVGYFETRDEAARAYDRVAREIYGEFARPNLPD
jgi:hypothetical protein